MADTRTESPPVTFKFCSVNIKVDCIFGSLEAAESAFVILAEKQGVLLNPLTNEYEQVKVFVYDKEIETERLREGYAAFVPHEKLSSFVLFSPPPDPNSILSKCVLGSKGSTLGKTVGQILDEMYDSDDDEDDKGQPLQ